MFKTVKKDVAILAVLWTLATLSFSAFGAVALGEGLGIGSRIMMCILFTVTPLVKKMLRFISSSFSYNI